MEAPQIKIPYGLEIKDLLRVEFLSEFQSAPDKTPAESIRISGAGGVTVMRAGPGADQGTLTAKHDPQAFLALLQPFENAHFLEAVSDEDEFPPEGLHFLSLKIPGRSNRVAIAGKDMGELNRLAGAVRMAVGLGVPEIFEKGFLKKL